MIIQGDVRQKLKELPDTSVNCCVTSPPYWGLRDYGMDGQLGLEKTPEQYVQNMVEVFREVKRVLRDDGTLWLNLGDSYMGASSEHKDGGSFGENSVIAKKTQSGIPNGGRKERHNALKEMGLKQKDLVGIPWMVAFALRADGWYLRSDIIWHKPNPMPESVTDRPTKAHEYIFLLSKSERYYYDIDAIREPHTSLDDLQRRKTLDNKGDYGGVRPDLGRSRDEFFHEKGRNKRTVWTVTTKPFADAHFATYPPELIEPCIIAGCPEGGTVLDPFNGAGTTGLVALQNNRQYIGIELNPEYVKIAEKRLSYVQPKFIF